MRSHTFKTQVKSANYLKGISGVTFGLIGLTMIAGGALTTSLASADDVVDEVSITVPTSCTMTGSVASGNEHTAEIANGIYQANIGTTTITALCNDNAGFSIYAAGYTGEEIGGTNSNKLVGTEASSNATIDTGTATGPVSNNDNSNWAMKLATDSQATYPITILSDENEQSFASYHAVPNEYTKVATRLTGTDTGTGATGASLTTTYAAYISKTQPADTYSGKVKYTLVHPNTAPAPVASLCTPGQREMQNVSNWQSEVTTGNEVTACDNRDGKTYTVARLADGNLWMTQNLDHDIKSDSSVIYDNTTTDLGWNTSTNQYDTASWTPTSSATTIATNDKANWTGTNTAPQSYDPGDLYWNGTESDFSDWYAYLETCTMDQTTYTYSNCNESLNPISTYTSSTGNSHYHLGNYYNWTAAVAMTDSSSLTTQGTLVEQSICPAGWTLPRIGNGDDTFKALWDEYGFTDSSINGDDKLWTSPLYFPASGAFSGVADYVGGYGVFWSPVVNNDEKSYDAGFITYGYLYSASLDLRLYGGSVRCVARPVSSTVSF